jgi:HAD superfamily hydrolase (TIGR01549 family)
MQKKSNIQLVVFDLDGTLMKSDLTIYNSMVETLREIGISTEIPKEEFDKFIGYHFQDIFDYFKINVGDLDSYISKYKETYFKNLSQTELYPGVLETLRNLKHKQIKTAILTTKAQDQLEKIITYFELNNYFDYLYGRRLNSKIKPSPEPLLEIMDILKVDNNSTIMVGDTELDIMCGNSAKTFTVFVEYGYGKLNGNFTHYKFSNITQLLEII